MAATWHAPSLFRHVFARNLAPLQAPKLTRTLPLATRAIRFQATHVTQRTVSSWTSRQKPFEALHHASQPSPGYFSSNSSSTSIPLPPLSRPSVGYWLIFSSALVFGIVVVGGVTRLTESGLSITEWKPVSGILPPLTTSDWDAEFDKYKATPEFKLYVHASVDTAIAEGRLKAEPSYHHG